MKIEFTRDEVQAMVMEHVTDLMGISFDEKTQTMEIDIGTGYSSAAATVKIISKEKDAE